MVVFKKKSPNSIKGFFIGVLLQTIVTKHGRAKYKFMPLDL